jgi:nicotinic acid mononucleotide adenylyltransferase
MGAFSSYVYLNEAKRSEGAEPKKAVFTFGRFNPPTMGHAKLIESVERIAKESNADPYIFLSQSHDREKNPLSYQDKLVFMRKLFGDINLIENTQIKNPFQACGYLGSYLKYTDVIMVAGSDRVDEYKRRFTHPDKYYDGFEVVSAGERDPDSDHVAGMSGTKARMAASKNDIDMFTISTGWDGDLALELMRAVQRGMQNG